MPEKKRDPSVSLTQVSLSPVVFTTSSITVQEKEEGSVSRYSYILHTTSEVCKGFLNISLYLKELQMSEVSITWYMLCTSSILCPNFLHLFSIIYPLYTSRVPGKSRCDRTTKRHISQDGRCHFVGRIWYRLQSGQKKRALPFCARFERTFRENHRKTTGQISRPAKEQKNVIR